MKKRLCIFIALVMLAGSISASPALAAEAGGQAALPVRMLAESTFEAGDDQPADTVLGTVVAEPLTLWAEAYEGSDALGEFSSGQAVYIFYRDGDFYFVQIPGSGLTGYMLVEFVEAQDIVPTAEATPEPTEEPTPEPTEEPTPEPTEEPTPEPTEEPTPEPTEEPTPEPTEEPTPEPTEEPTPEPTEEPTEEPTAEPTEGPTAEPTAEPTAGPTAEPTAEPTAVPTGAPTAEPTEVPTGVPTAEPTPAPTATPTPAPTATPTPTPTGPYTEPTERMIYNAVDGVLTKSGVNMRKGPSTKYGLVDSNLKSGLQLTVYAKDGDWYFLRVDKTGKYGYIHEDYVSLDDDDEPTPTKKATSEPAIRLSQGDVNGDGLVSAADAALILRYDAGIIDLSDAPLEAADMDGDDQVTSVDAKTLLRYVANRLAR